ncbi:type IV pilus twitching motility protein PilT [Clostridium sp. D2Q-11]|uniref:Type IV pilus twitching motility protein PilT n=1 Tax=Anaeromonas frigoriresistens TaxID=2683708 RepID=A0A942UVI4_9FIRM|nr:type IV pilus twitching motility protein PilT [Anaeromonas frigoriresistens]MBS4540014.1 type IV pilus twitching motility protein PilT [Anaeromonas frigoriresistens]
MNIKELLNKAINMKASDLHITVGYPPVLRINGHLEKMEGESLTPEDNHNLVKQILDEKELNILEEKGQLDKSHSIQGIGRFRVNVYKQRGTYGVAIRTVSLSIPTIEELQLPSLIKELTTKRRGLVLVTGPTGSGKSTTLASMINEINNTRKDHILTLEDPIEYLHKHNKSIVNQREIGTDSYSFAEALRSALRQDPDVILVGEMRDLETISTALIAAETGHLVLSTLHTIGAAKTIDRIIDVFPSEQQQQIRVQLSNVLEGIISQQLLPNKDNTGRALAIETMVATPAIKNLIREGKAHQIQTAIVTGKKYGMDSMDNSLMNLYKRGIISKDDLENHSIDKDMVKRYIGI